MMCDRLAATRQTIWREKNRSTALRLSELEELRVSEEERALLRKEQSEPRQG